MQLWLTPEQAAPHLPYKNRKAIYDKIWKGTFPFEYRRSGRAILISARDLGLITDNANEEKAQEQDQSLAATA